MMIRVRCVTGFWLCTPPQVLTDRLEAQNKDKSKAIKKLHKVLRLQSLSMQTHTHHLHVGLTIVPVNK